MSSSTFTSLSPVAHSPRGLGVKEYRVYDLSVTIDQMGADGFFNRYDLSGFQLGDMVRGFASNGSALWEITGEDNDDGGKSLTIRSVNASQTAPNIVSLFVADAASLRALCSLFMTDTMCVETMRDAIWTSMMGTKIAWDGTKLDIDYNDNGNLTS